MSISKTRQKLVDVARQLFAKNGIANTTMNDIAKASGKGRRTLYTYFKSKDDVYYAVIESELERLSDKLDEVAAKNISPQDKIIELIYTHLSMIKETVMRNGNLRAEFFRNIWMVEKARKNFDEDEIELFRKVYSDAKEDGDFDIFDFNMGCPVPKIVNNGEGCALMKNPKLVEEILSKLVKSVKKPVTLKIRRGFDSESINAVDIAKIAENAGVSAVAVHGRTREQYYLGKADWDIIKDVKSAVNIPVIGNGDVADGESAKRMYEYTGCDGIMVARGDLGVEIPFMKIRRESCTAKKKFCMPSIRCLFSAH